MTNRGGSGDGGRATKAQRKEEARLQRLDIQRRAAKRRRTRGLAFALVIVLAAGVAAFVITRPKPVKADLAKLLAQAPAAAQAAECSGVRDVGPYSPESQDQAHVGSSSGPATMPPLSSYPSVPPASGPHSATPVGAGVYSDPPPIDQALHSLEHGAAILWYAPTASGPELEKIKDFYADQDVGSRVIVAPYDYSSLGQGGQLPAGVEVAMVSWHQVETCSKPSLAAAFGFTAQYASPPWDGKKYLGVAPEPGAAI